MINRLIEFSLKNRWPHPAGLRAAGRLGLLGTAPDADRRHSRSQREPGDRLHRLGGPQPAGSRRPDHVSADRQPARTGGSEGRAFVVGIGLLDDQHHLPGQRSIPILPARGSWNG